MSALITKFFVEGAKLAGADAVLRVGGAIAEKTGLVKAGTDIAGDVGSAVLDLFGYQAPSAAASPAPASPPVGDSPAPTTGEGPGGEAPRGGVIARVKHRICAWCAPPSSPIFAGVDEGTEIEFGRCENHEADALATAQRVQALYLGWAESVGITAEDIGAANCGPAPIPTDSKYRTFWGNLDETKFYKAQADHQACLSNYQQRKTWHKQKEHQQEKAGERKGYIKERGIARVALSAQKKKYEDQIAAMQKAQADAATAADKAALQKQIDDLKAQKDGVDKLLATTQQTAKDDATKAQIDALSREVAQKAQQPGGMDQMMQMLMMKSLLGPGAPSAAPPIIVAPGAPAAPASLPWAASDGGGRRREPQQDAVPQDGQPVINVFQTAPDDDDIEYAGADDEPIDPELARDLGISGATTLGEAMTAYNLRNAGWSEDEFNEFMNEIRQPHRHGPNCAQGSCGLG